MSWVSENTLTWLQSFVIKVLKAGHVPKHVAIIMDGNRRYAQQSGIERVEGHLKGSNKLSETIEWCRKFGIKEVTAYAFSIENYKRTHDEVIDLLDLVKLKFLLLLKDIERLKERGISVRIIGNLSLIPEDLREVMVEATRATKNNKTIVLNVAFCYTSKDEITQAVNSVLKGITEGDITIDDVDEDLISKCLYTYKSRNPDLMIRTSGEVRFSDYLMWQSSSTCLYFTKVLWPDFSAWDMINAVFYYQRCYNDIIKFTQDFPKKDSLLNKNVKSFIAKLYNQREEIFEDSSI